ncbi:MAG: hypothetical protein K9M45_05985 [Kiritimatiellales bacterium]|nr:hypothetical protein [Kiritimatiellales bacterium]
MMNLVRLVLIFCVLGVGVPVQAEEEFREFKPATGNAINAYIKDFDAKRDMVTLKLYNGRTQTVPVAAFCEADQSFIRDWPYVDAFMSIKKLRVYLDEPKRISKWHKETWGLFLGREDPKHLLTRDFKRMVYPIRVVNSSEIDMTNVTVKCCVYSKHERIDHAVEQEVVDLMTTPKKHVIELIKAKGNLKFDSQSVVLITKEFAPVNNIEYMDGDCRRQDAWMEGIVIRFCWTTPGGQELVREQRYPKNLSERQYKWAEPTGEEMEAEYDETSNFGAPKNTWSDDEMSDDDDGT